MCHTCGLSLVTLHTQVGDFWQLSRWDLHYTVHESFIHQQNIRQRHEETILKILSVVFVKLTPPHKPGSKVLYITDYPLIRNIGTLMATPPQAPASDWFTSKRRRKLFFGEEALSQSDGGLVRVEFPERRGREDNTVISTSPPANNNNTTVNITLHF